ncbi:MAG: hypothetical protein J7598_17010 [Mitsuaria chitosanitabida]|uniref:hypothetical protein n=1 Tax=Roseateles chitosanitabidus TaxID=65048 RepID=UPI001B28BDDF|nr:hypothetical protein [Roseateles chitosanitabidus]MBO9688305.1 hypothetical protein [Roseateles chitosanitabidus]
MSEKEATPRITGIVFNLRTVPLVPVLMLIQVTCRLFQQSVLDAVLYTLVYSLFAIPAYFLGGLRTFNEAAEWFRSHGKFGHSILTGMILATIMMVAIDPLPMAVASLIAAFFFYHGVFATAWWAWSRVCRGGIAGIAIALLVVALFAMAGFSTFTDGRAFHGFDELKTGMSRSEVIALMGTPTQVERPGVPFTRHSSVACSAPCAERLWYEHHLMPDVEARSVDLDANGKVIDKYRWTSP